LFCCRCAWLPRDETKAFTQGQTLPKVVIEAWATIPKVIRDALVSHEMAGPSAQKTGPTVSRSQSTFSSESDLTPGSSGSSATSGDAVGLDLLQEKCDITGATIDLQPLERAPNNVFSFTKKSEEETTRVESKAASTVTTTTKIVTASRGWRNIFTLPISYDVNMVAHGTIFDPANAQLIQSTGPHSEGYNRRFAAVDNEVYSLYGPMIHDYFEAMGIELTVCVLNGGEADKRSKVSFQPFWNFFKCLSSFWLLTRKLCFHTGRRQPP
jgi:hypothetical protein